MVPLEQPYARTSLREPIVPTPPRHIPSADGFTEATAEHHIEHLELRPFFIELSMSFLAAFGERWDFAKAPLLGLRCGRLLVTNHCDARHLFWVQWLKQSRHLSQLAPYSPSLMVHWPRVIKSRLRLLQSRLIQPLYKKLVTPIPSSWGE